MDHFAFKVKPEKGQPFYFTVRVFHSRKEMFAYYDSLPDKQGKANGFAAITIPWEHLLVFEGRKKPAVAPDIGEILFHRQRSGMGVVSHEMTHAALHYMRLKKQSLALDADDCKSEEALALVVGNLTRQFVMKY